ncbi:exodeoxyribonuclease III [Haloplasma contractile]|uniref:Exodeoxyribonuclease protein n=1 Tax=Haloplasma contractile SSD-17B TaxID=1033810 RepID=U2DY09_9MOLU|nr:exodeoxyribonuclease III [Haloplasma contractile]ERJ13147.1 Exodeoxyribonuclease protein [Haloplasma contractile SSD-17B]
MKLVSWNVNGLRACMKKGFKEFFNEMNADLFAIQETKMQEEQKTFDFEGYHEFWNCADKKGYSGTLIYSKQKPLNVVYGIDGSKYNDEGRIITLEFKNFFFVTAYVPNSQRSLARLDYRMEFEDDFRAYLKKLDSLKPVIMCGDLNVAHREIDLTNPKNNEKNAGFTIEERRKYQSLLDEGFTDSYRYLHPEKVEYSWWSYMFNARKRNIGWRIDYFVISNKLRGQLNDSIIHTQTEGSDHCPISLDIEVS